MQNTTQKKCSTCRSLKPSEAFCRPGGSNRQREYATCNQCSERTKNTRKRSKREENQDAEAPDNMVAMSRDSSSTGATVMSRSSSAPGITMMSRSNSALSTASEITYNLHHLETDFEESNFQVEQTQDEYSTANTCYDRDTGGFLYSLDEVQELVAEIFQEAESSNIPATMAFETELNATLVDILSAGQDDFVVDTLDLEEIKNGFHKLANIIHFPIESGSHYYWEVCKVNVSTKKKKPTGCATVYLACTQWIDRQWKRPEDQPIQRKSETRAPIPHFACMGSIKLSIDLQQNYILVQGEHQQAHQHPQYWQVEFPAKAKQWIEENSVYDL